MSEERYDLPLGWEWAALGEICTPVSRKNPETEPDRNFRYIDISSIDNTSNKVIGHKDYVGRDAPSRARQQIKSFDVLFSTVRTYLRNVAMVPSGYDGDLASTGFCVLRAATGIEPYYIFRYLLTEEFIQTISEQQRGTSYPAVTDADVFAEKVPLAPSAEQLRIVEKSEALFEQSRTAREALDRIPTLIRQFRQSVLAAAFRGDLTERDPSDEPASSLLERIRNKEAKYPETSSLPELPEQWCWGRYEQLTSFITSGSRGWAEYYANAGPLFIRVGNLRYNTVSLDLSEPIYVDPPNGMERIRTRVQSGDLLIAITGNTIGMVAVVPDTIDEAYINQHIALTRPLIGFEAKYVAYYLASWEGGQKQISEFYYGMTKPGMNLTNIRDLLIPFAPYNEQLRIVAKIENAFALANNLEIAIEAARHRVEMLDQAILARAFRGGLVPQDPNDEPASALLERLVRK